MLSFFFHRCNVYTQDKQASRSISDSVLSAAIECSTDNSKQLNLVMKNPANIKTVRNILEMPFLTARTEGMDPPPYQYKSTSSTSITITGDLPKALNFLEDYDIIKSDSIQALKREIGCLPTSSYG